MPRCLSLNGRIDDDALIPGASSAVLYGRGVFTTIAIREGRPFLWEKHWKRLNSNAADLSIDISSHSAPETLNFVEELIAENSLSHGRARVTLLDESYGSIWQHLGERKTSLLIAVAGNRERSDRIRLIPSPYRVNSASPLAGVKSCNYLEHLMAYEEAQARGFDEAIRLNEKGRVTSACMANVFWEAGGRLYTPSLSTGCLAGTTREFVMENFDCEEVEVGIEEIESAERIFLTSAGLGVAPVAEFNGRRLDTSEHRILELLPI